MRAAVITVSSSRTEGEDESGRRLAEFAESLGAQVAGRELVADDREKIAAVLRRWADYEGCELVLTTGGTGLGPADMTPEATREVIEREAPGIPEAMRLASREHTSHWMLSRSVAGTRGRTLIVNFPGSPASIEQAGAAIRDSLPHALALLAGSGHGTHGDGGRDQTAAEG
jgi:molybdopterin adenylyltransferase